MENFREIWLVDFEFHQNGIPGNPQMPVCLVAREFHSGRLIRCWQDELRSMDSPPFDLGEDCLYVAYLASAELHCHLALGWEMPCNVLDLFAEFRNMTNGRMIPGGRRNLLAALRWYGLAAISETEKDDWRDLILAGGPWSEKQQTGILDYCQTDVDALAGLLPKMAQTFSTRPMWMEHALIRGRYMKAVAAMEFRGVPVDTDILRQLVDNWASLKVGVIERVCKDFDLFEGTTFKAAKFEALLDRRGIHWPRTESGRLALDEDTFKQQCKIHTWLEPVRDVRDTLGKLRLNKLEIGEDGRNRVMSGVFGAKTGRNTPSNAKFIFGPSAWLRGLIKPAPGMGLAYVDFSSQEIAIAAKLSGDVAMMEGYQSDPYIDFAIRAGLAPEGATKATHKEVRQLCKATVLGTQYGMGEKTLANQTGMLTCRGRQLLQSHWEAYRDYWAWVDAAINQATFRGYIDSVFGWRLHTADDSRPTTIQNFPCQANGAEMLRIACILAHEAGIGIIATVHDAILMEARLETLDRDVEHLREIMTEAGRQVLGGFPVRTDADIVRYPDRYSDERGAVMWALMLELLAEIGPKRGPTC